MERSDKFRGDDVDKARDKLAERYEIERSVEKGPDRGISRSHERNKDDRSKQRNSEASLEKSHADDHFHSQSLPPPPPLPPSMIPQSFGASRRDEDADRRIGATRHSQRLSQRHYERERRRSEGNSSLSQDDAKRIREDDFCDRKRDDRESLLAKVEERERERMNLKEDMDTSAAAYKRRKLKREQHMPSAEPGEYTPYLYTSVIISFNGYASTIIIRWQR